MINHIHKPTNLYTKGKKGEERKRESFETKWVESKGYRIWSRNVILFLFPYIVQTEKKGRHPHGNEINALWENISKTL